MAWHGMDYTKQAWAWSDKCMHKKKKEQQNKEAKHNRARMEARTKARKGDKNRLLIDIQRRACVWCEEKQRVFVSTHAHTHHPFLAILSHLNRHTHSHSSPSLLLHRCSIYPPPIAPYNCIPICLLSPRGRVDELCRSLSNMPTTYLAIIARGVRDSEIVSEWVSESLRVSQSRSKEKTEVFLNY